MLKTNKTVSKRFRVSKSGKLLARKAGRNHFSAKESRSKQLKRKRLQNFNMSNKMKSRYLLSG